MQLFNFSDLMLGLEVGSFGENYFFFISWVRWENSVHSIQEFLENVRVGDHKACFVGATTAQVPSRGTCEQAVSASGRAQQTRVWQGCSAASLPSECSRDVVLFFLILKSH